MDTWPPVDLHVEDASSAADAGSQPDRSAWSRRHAALRRISEMALDDSQLECAPYVWCCLTLPRR